MKRYRTVFFLFVLLVGLSACRHAAASNESGTTAAEREASSFGAGTTSHPESRTTAAADTTAQTKNSTPPPEETGATSGSEKQEESTSIQEETTPPPKETLPIKREDVTSAAPDTNADSGSSETEAVPVPAVMELKKIGKLQYYLYTPQNPTENMSLIVYLHGGTNKKADVTELLTTEGFPKYLNDGYYGNLSAYVAVPKLENSSKGWADVSEEIRALIQELHQSCGICVNRVALTGHSMGGTGVYQLQVKLPNTFACIAPMSGSIKNTAENLDALSKTKIWAFIGTNDTIVDPKSTRIIIQALQEIGTDAKLTELRNATHFDVPALAYQNGAFIQWLVHCGE